MTSFIDHSPQLQQRHNLKLDVEGVVETVLATFPDLAHDHGRRPGRRPAGEKREISPRR